MTHNNRAIPWLLAWSIIHTLSISVAKTLDQNVSTLTIVFFRSLFGFLFLIPPLMKHGFVKTLVPKKPVLMGARVGFMLLAMFCTYAAYRALDLSVATTIGFTQSMIMTTLAALILKERVTLPRWAVIVVGYIGVLFFTKSEGDWSFQMGLGVALCANLFASLAIITTKKLTHFESPLAIVSIPYLVITLITGVLNTYEGWAIPSFETLLLLMGIAGAFTFTQYAYVKALTYCETSFAAPFEYLRLVVAIPVGCLYFCEVLNANKIIGVSIILLSNFYLIKRRKA